MRLGLLDRLARFVLIAVVVAFVQAGPGVAPVIAASPEEILSDCAADEELNGNYSNADLRKALKAIPADAVDYTSCWGLLKEALRDVASGGSSKSKTDNIGVGEEAKLNEAQRRMIEEAVADSRKKPKAVRIGPGVVDPGSVESSSAIPTPLIVVLLTSGLVAAAAGVEAIRRRWRGIRRE